MTMPSRAQPSSSPRAGRFPMGEQRSPQSGTGTPIPTPLLRLATACILGVASALLVSCGSSGKGLIPAADAGPLRSDFEAVASDARAGAGSCAATEAALLQTEHDFGALPATLDSGLRERLQAGIKNLRARALELCAQPGAPATATGSSPTTTTSTQTPSTTPTVPQTTTTRTTPTTTTSTTTTPSTGGGTPAPSQNEGSSAPGSGRPGGGNSGAGGQGAGEGNGGPGGREAGGGGAGAGGQEGGK
jgi:hypothetical protein